MALCSAFHFRSAVIFQISGTRAAFESCLLHTNGASTRRPRAAFFAPVEYVVSTSAFSASNSAADLKSHLRVFKKSFEFQNSLPQSRPLKLASLTHPKNEN